MNSEARDRARVTQIAQTFLSGEITAIVACCQLAQFVHSAPQIFAGDDWKYIVAVESETDVLPIGRLRELWHPDFLPEKDRQIVSYEASCVEDVREICERILLRIGVIQ